MQDSLSLMVFAAGFGRRMAPLTDKLPKPLIEVAGRTLFDRTLDLAEDAGCAPVVVNTHYLADQMRPEIQARGAVESHETPDILDTGGGLKAALPLLGTRPLATLNSDVVWIGPNPIRQLAEIGLGGENDGLLLLVPAARAHARRDGGDFALSGDGQITRPGPFIYTGAQLIRPEVVAAEPDCIFSLNRVWDRLIGAGRLAGVVYSGDWCDIGHPEGIRTAESLLEAACG